MATDAQILPETQVTPAPETPLAPWWHTVLLIAVLLFASVNGTLGKHLDIDVHDWWNSPHVLHRLGNSVDINHNSYKTCDSEAGRKPINAYNLMSPYDATKQYSEFNIVEVAQRASPAQLPFLLLKGAKLIVLFDVQGR